MLVSPASNLLAPHQKKKIGKEATEKLLKKNPPGFQRGKKKKNGGKKKGERLPRKGGVPDGDIICFSETRKREG